MQKLNTSEQEQVILKGARKMSSRDTFGVTENGEDVGFSGDYVQAVEELNRLATWYFQRDYQNESVAVEGNYTGWICRKGMKIVHLAIVREESEGDVY